MASMAERITFHLDGDMDLIVPTTVVMVAMTSFLLGVILFFMGIFRVTSIANYMPYPGASVLAFSSAQISYKLRINLLC